MKNPMKSTYLYPIVAFIAGALLTFLLFGGGDDSHGHDHSVSQDEGNGTVWTCSMHPSIRDDEPGTCPICAMDLIPATSGEGMEDDFSMVMSESAMRLAEVQTTPAILEVPEYLVWAPGRIEVNEQKLSVISAHFAGRITELFVDFTGAEVRRGEPLARVYSEELIVAQRELLEAYKRRDVSPALYRAARQKLAFWELTDSQIDEIIERGEVQNDFDILAPSSGTVITRNISRNDYINRGQALFEIADLSSVWLIMDVFERDASHIKTGSDISFNLQAVPGETRNASVSFVEPLFNAANRTLRVRAQTENNDGLLRPGMLLSGNIGVADSEARILVPSSAVLWTGPRSIVYVRDMEADSPRFEAREVTLGHRTGDYFVIEEGIEEGEQVVFHGAFKMDSEMQLADRFSMMNRVSMDDDMHHSESIERFEDVPESFKGQLTEVIELYLIGKDALVESEFEPAVEVFTRMKERVQAIGEHSLPGSGHEAWMERYAALTQHGNLLAEADDIDEVRTQFRFISDELIKAVRQFGVEGVVYQQYCPMTFDWEGSYWLSTEEQIANPYLPETMLMCGEVIERLE